MELIKNAEYRTVEYFGEELKIPAHHCYIAADEDGFVYSFDRRPYYQNGGWVHDNDSSVHSIQYIALFNLQDLEDQDTLVEYPRIKMSVI